MQLYQPPSLLEHTRYTTPPLEELYAQCRKIQLPSFLGDKAIECFRANLVLGSTTYATFAYLIDHQSDLRLSAPDLLIKLREILDNTLDQVTSIGDQLQPFRTQLMECIPEEDISNAEIRGIILCFLIRALHKGETHNEKESVEFILDARGILLLNIFFAMPEANFQQAYPGLIIERIIRNSTRKTEGVKLIGFKIVTTDKNNDDSYYYIQEDYFKALINGRVVFEIEERTRTGRLEHINIGFSVWDMTKDIFLRQFLIPYLKLPPNEREGFAKKWREAYKGTIPISQAIHPNNARPHKEKTYTQELP